MVSKVLVIVDSLNSAIGISASQRALLSNWQVISALDFHSPKKFLSYLENTEAEIFLFAWRQALIDLVYTSIKKEKFLKLLENKSVFFVVTDHLGLDPKFHHRESIIHEIADGYFVTSQLLVEEYSARRSLNSPCGIYFDLPDEALINKIENEKLKRDPCKITWVGNSNWGNHFGYNDHKGFYEIILPLKEALKEINPEICFEIIDSASGIMSNEDVLRTIATSNILLLSSESEGTGIPLLEALALGTIPITTRVGVADQLLNFAFPENLVAREMPSFLIKVQRMIGKKLDYELAKSVYKQYIEHAKQPLHFEVKEKRNLITKTSRKNQFLSIVIWKARYFRKRLRRIIMNANRLLSCLWAK